MQRATTATRVFLDEFLPTTTGQVAPVQSAALPANCRLTPTTGQGYGSNSPDGQFALFSCAMDAAVARMVVRINPQGTCDTSTTYSVNSAAFPPRGATAVSSTSVWASDPHAIYSGLFGTHLTSHVNGTKLTTVLYYYASKVVPFAGADRLFVTGCVTSEVPCNSARLVYSNPALPTLATANTMNLIVPGLGAIPALSDFVFASSTLLYTGSDSASVGSFRKWASPAAASPAGSSWTAATFGDGFTTRNYPGSIGVHGLTGRAEAGSAFVLYMSTSQATGNLLLRYDTAADGSAVPGAGFTLLATAPAGQGFLGVMFAPAVPSSSATPSITPSGTPSASTTPSVTASPSTTATTSPTATASSSATASGTPASTASATSSASNTASATASISGGATASATGTAAETTTATPSATPSPSGTGSGSGTPSGTASGSLTASGTPSNSPSASITPSGTPTATATRPGHFERPLAGDSILVQLVSTAIVQLQELTNAVAGPAVVAQTAVLPATCTLTTAAAHAYGSNSADGGMAVFPCGSQGTCARRIARVYPNGTVDLSTGWTTTTCTYLPRGAAAAGSTTWYAADARATWASGSTFAPFELTSANYYGPQVVARFNGTNTLLTGGCAGATAPCPVGSIYYSSPAMPSSATNTHNLAMGGVAVPALGQFLVRDSFTLYAGSDTTAAGGGLYKFVSLTGRVSDVWSAAPMGAGGLFSNPSNVVAGVHGLAGRAEGATYALYLTTSAVTVNAVYRYDTAFDESTVVGAGYTLLATAPTFNAYRAVFVAPVVPSASATRSSSRSATASASTSPSVSASASITASGSITASTSLSASVPPTTTPSITPSSSATASTGATPSQTPSVTPSASSTESSAPTSTSSSSATPTSSNSPSASVTPSGTPTPTASAPGHFGGPLTQGNLLVQRATTATRVFLDEFLPTTTGQVAPVQSAALPANCRLTPTTGQGYGSNSPDGQFALFSCAVDAAVARMVVRVDPQGTCDTSTTYNVNNAAYPPRGATAATGSSALWAADGHAVYYGTAGTTLLSKLTTTNWYYNIKVQQFAGAATLFYAACDGNTIPCAAGKLYYSSPLLPTSATTNSMDRALPGVVYSGVGDFVFASSSVLYAGADHPTTGGLRKYTSATGTLAGTWAAPTFGGGTALRNGPFSIGVHGLTGRAEGGAFILYWSTSAATGNRLFRYDTAADGSAVPGAGFSLLATAPAGQGFLGVMFAPAVPSPSTTATSSLTATASVSATPSGTASSSTTASNTGTVPVTPSGSLTASVTASLTPSKTAPLTRSATRTGTPAESTTRTGTPSASSTETPSVSASGSETASVSATETSTPSVSATASATGSVSATGTDTGSASPSSTGTPSSSSSVTGSGSPSVTSTPAATGTSSGTRTVAASVTSTKTRVPLPSVSATRTKVRAGLELSRCRAAPRSPLNHEDAERSLHLFNSPEMPLSPPCHSFPLNAALPFPDPHAHRQRDQDQDQDQDQDAHPLQDVS